MARMVDACAANGILPFYGPFGDIADLVGCEDQFRNAFLMGCVGAWSLHPSQIDIANQLSMDRATMMALVNRLESRDLLERQPSPIDRRRQELLLTEAGAEVLKQARNIQQQHELRFTSRFSPEELEQFIEGLKRVYADIIPRNSQTD